MGSVCSFGVFLNMSSRLGDSAVEVFDYTTTAVECAEGLGYEHIWVTEHHFIRFGINPSALTAAAFLLGRTRRIRVGTAVVLTPLCHPVELAERAALLDQFSGGRFDLGIGRGGYLRDYTELGIDTARWEDEPQATAQRLLEIWGTGEPDIQPPPRTVPHPPLLVATSSQRGLAFAAANGLALQHYFATPVAARMALEQRYRDESTAIVDHLHTLVVVIGHDAGLRERLAAALTSSFRDGQHPHVPQAGERHLGPDGKPVGPDEMAQMVAAGAIVGPPSQVVDELGGFLGQTGARRLAVYHEAIGDPKLAMSSMEDFALKVVPQLR